MRQSDYGNDRETIWGINRKDRRWFQLLTLVGGMSGSITLTILELAYQSGNATANEVARNILLGIGASFVASGFIAWGLLQIKELTMAIADWIREYTEKKREQWRQEGIEKGRQEGRQEGHQQGHQQGRQEGRQEGHQQGRQEGYAEGYEDARKGKPQQPPDAEPDHLS